MKIWKENIKIWNFEKKIRFFLTMVISGTSIIILLVSTISAVFYLTRQSRQMARDQLVTLSSNYDDVLRQYQNLAVAFIMTESVQDYCKNLDEEEGAEQRANSVYSELLNMLNIQNNLNFAAVIDKDKSGYVYKGNSSVVDTQFEQMFEIDYEESIPGKQNSTVHLSFGNHYFRTRDHTLTLYHPVYLTKDMINECGTLVMNFNDNMLEQLYYRNDLSMDSEMFLMDINGRMVSVADGKKLDTVVPYLDRIQSNSGDFWDKGRLVNYQKVGVWNYYLVNVIPTGELYKDSLNVLVILLLVILLVTMISISIIRRMITRFYKPINKVVSVMDDVTGGQLDTRIDMGIADDDSRKLADGFNAMMDEINLLVEQVKMEQHQMEQIRFNALQSQIQPHFLYNTLECIHWKAVADGNKEISTMVKAMAQYYRVCLSKGKEIISLKEEINHIRSYLIIQNMRYDDIVELEIDIPRRYEEVKILKMTLQPLIENSIYHGIKVKEGKTGTIHISIRQEGESVYLMIADSGTGMTQEEIDEMNQSISVYDESFGYGVRNVNKRIELVFGPQYGLRYQKNMHGGVSVEIHLPLEMETYFEEVL